MKNICVITGASSGIGKEFFVRLSKDGDFSFDEFWVIARSEERLKELSKLTDIPVRAIPLDLSDENSYESYKKLLEEEEPRISLLVNCSGYGKFESVEKVGYEVNLNMIDLNVKGTVAMDYLSLKYMEKGSGIINIASVAAYQPIPYINTYGATKSFVLNFTRALSMELRDRGIKVMAVCPFWTKTEFFDRAIKNEADPVVKKYAAMYDARDIVKRAIRDYKKGKSVSLFGFVTKLQLLGVKLMPVGIVMRVWMSQQKLWKRK
ncbi:MAG: SDR family NAD(P)-dependent oxidoreductase [Clostridia bacterium]|nr:SDR family NAD(P)-dependent oxidoreductase [Clostridia bacterium]